jgi:hypothetical protein
MRRLLLAFASLACSPSAAAPADAPRASACPPSAPNPEAAGERRAENRLLLAADYPRDSPPLPDGLPLSGDMITCDFRVFASGDAARGNPLIKVSTQTPVTMTFAGLHSKEPRLKGNHGESPIVIASDSPEEIVIVERNGLGNVFTYTIARETGLAIWTKAYFMLRADKPVGSLSVGRCY